MSNEALRIADLSVSIGGHEPLSHISFSLPQGSFTVIVGPNGAGKSILLKTILGLCPLSSGTILLWNQPSKLRDPMTIGYVPQIKTLKPDFPARGIDLVVNGMRATWPWKIRSFENEQALAALERVGAQKLANKRLSHLSGGELQRIYLARSLVRKPSLFILDEPATGIDTVGEADLYHILEEERQRGATIVMVSHDLHAAMHHASHVVVLNRMLVAFGEPSKALNDESLKRAFGHQRHAHGMGFAHV